MEDFHRAGGLLAVLREVRDLLDPDALTVTGEPLADSLDDAPIWDAEAIRTRARPLVAEGGIAVLRGDLAPDGALIKPAAASPHLLRHRGRPRLPGRLQRFGGDPRVALNARPTSGDGRAQALTGRRPSPLRRGAPAAR